MTTLVTFVPAATSVRAAAAELCSWLTFTASVLFTPAATLVILSPPTSSPLAVLVSVVLLVASPSFTLVNSGVSLVATVTLLPACVIAMFLPASTVTVSPGPTCSSVVPLTVPSDALVVRLKPLFATSLTDFSCSCVAATPPV